MKDTNAIEDAIRNKCKKELDLIANGFINELEIKIIGEYGGSSYYDFWPPNASKYSFSAMGKLQLKGVLTKMLYEAHLESMVTVKSQELVSKLQLEI